MGDCAGRGGIDFAACEGYAWRPANESDCEPNSFVGSAHFSMPRYNSKVVLLEIAHSAGATVARRCSSTGRNAHRGDARIRIEQVAHAPFNPVWEQAEPDPGTDVRNSGRIQRRGTSRATIAEEAGRPVNTKSAPPFRVHASVGWRRSLAGFLSLLIWTHGTVSESRLEFNPFHRAQGVRCG